MKITVIVKDKTGQSVIDAQVKANIDGEIMKISDLGNGNYEETIDTSDLAEGTYNITITAEKTPGYESTQASSNLTVESTINWILYGGIAVIAIGAIVVIYLVRRK